MQNGSITTTNTYKYLGFIFTPSGELCSGLKDLRDRALRAYHKLKTKMGHYFRLHPAITLSLFDSLIKPILLYSSDFWGCLKMPKNNPIENMFVKFSKALLGVQKQTSNIGINLELGAVPIMFYGIKNCIKNWHRIHKKKEANTILLSVYEMAIENNLPWPTLVKQTLDSIGIGTESDAKNIQREALERMKDIYHQNSFEEINSENSKLRTYAKLKTNAKFEEYLNSVGNIMDRTALTKFRLSNHELMIEKGRHQGLDENQRTCPTCKNGIESEQHFLMSCTTYRTHREKLIADVTEISPTFTGMDENERFVFLLNEPCVSELIGKYLNKTLLVRKFLLGNHRENT